MTPPLRIVIADDEQDIRHGLHRLLAKLAYEVVGEASNGHELLSCCRETTPDVVITDIRMPIMSGIEAANELSKTHSIPIIVVSAHERPQTQTECISDFLLKPVSLTSLQAAIIRACPQA
ncbi:putative transcriptional regulatory protein pdtaR [Roseimaritima multifibrata]|uniref:Putative transcriptional regulatory protein pdtaR n=1 Tax=Roseimaritima multifibrata TaxID=1930274 RepID=A0A517MDQ9_9BACT|nr:response regulator [Roseimaritima multifibrata]QDS93024.1 putative transcriptional regulatory protein pdtaR [Roseimaritima multifibrata]